MQSHEVIWLKPTTNRYSRSGHTRWHVYFLRPWIRRFVGNGCMWTLIADYVCNCHLRRIAFCGGYSRLVARCKVIFLVLWTCEVNIYRAQFNNCGCRCPLPLYTHSAYSASSSQRLCHFSHRNCVNAYWVSDDIFIVVLRDNTTRARWYRSACSICCCCVFMT